MKRAVRILSVIVVSGFVAWFSGPLVRDNENVFLAIVTLFSVFGGFLVSVMSIGGNSVTSNQGTWARLELGRDSSIARMDRARLLFYAYLIAATLILVVLAIHKSQSPFLMLIFPVVNFLSLWFTVMGILFSFALPSMLIGIQQSKIDAEIERRRDRAPESICKYKPDGHDRADGEARH